MSEVNSSWQARLPEIPALQDKLKEKEAELSKAKADASSALQGVQMDLKKFQQEVTF